MFMGRNEVIVLNEISQSSEKQTFSLFGKCRFECMYCFCVDENGTQSFVCARQVLYPELYILFTQAPAQADLALQLGSPELSVLLPLPPWQPGCQISAPRNKCFTCCLFIYIFFCVIGSCSTALAGLELDVHTRLLANFIRSSYLCLPSSGIIGLSLRIWPVLLFFFFLISCLEC